MLFRQAPARKMKITYAKLKLIKFYGILKIQNALKLRRFAEINFY
jgi:hypothetical protein